MYNLNIFFTKIDEEPNPDPHVPVSRVQESTAVLESMHAEVFEKIYPNMGHTIRHDEIEKANTLIFKN